MLDRCSAAFSVIVSSSVSSVGMNISKRTFYCIRQNKKSLLYACYVQNLRSWYNICCLIWQLHTTHRHDPLRTFCYVVNQAILHLIFGTPFFHHPHLVQTAIQGTLFSFLQFSLSKICILDKRDLLHFHRISNHFSVDPFFIPWNVFEPNRTTK